MADPRADAIRAADAQTGNVTDPAAGAAAINALRRTVTLPVQTAEIRAVLWPRMEYARLVIISRRTEAEFNTTDKPQAATELAITTVALLDSGRTIREDDPAAWAAVTNGLGGLAGLQMAGAPVLSHESVQTVLALRTAELPQIEPPISDLDLVSIRSAAA